MIDSADPTKAALPTLDVISEPAERADAARNREKIFCTAQRLFEEHGVDNVSMDLIAREAGVGKGTLYRRFGDRAGLALQLLDENTRRFQDAWLRGAPPLGPGAPPAERLDAFLCGLADLNNHHLDLLAVAENTRVGGRYRSQVYSSFFHHARMLVEQIDPRLDAEATAHVLLAPLAADLLRHVKAENATDLERVKDALRALIRGLTAAA